MNKFKTLILILCCSLAIGCAPSYEEEMDIVMDYGKEIIEFSMDHGSFLLGASSTSGIISYATSEVKRGEELLEVVDKKRIHDSKLAKAKEKYREALVIELEALRYLESGNHEGYNEKSSEVSDVFGEGTDYLSE